MVDEARRATRALAATPQAALRFLLAAASLAIVGSVDVGVDVDVDVDVDADVDVDVVVVVDSIVALVHLVNDWTSNGFSW